MTKNDMVTVQNGHRLVSFKCLVVKVWFKVKNKMGVRLSFMIGLRYCSNVNSLTKIYDINGNGMYSDLVSDISVIRSYAWVRPDHFIFCLVRNGLNLKQAEWNILQMGTTKYESKCKQIRFKNVYLETTNLSVQKTIPLMTDQIIDVRKKYHRNVNIAYIT